MDDAEEETKPALKQGVQHFIHKHKKRCSTASFLVVLLVVGITLGSLVGVKVWYYSSEEVVANVVGVSTKTVADICNKTSYPLVCNPTLNGTDVQNPQAYVLVAMEAAMNVVNSSLYAVTSMRDSSPSQTGIQYSTLSMCVDMYQDSVEALNSSMYKVSQFKLQDEKTELNDLQQYVAAALTYLYTCLEGVQQYGVWSGGNHLNGTQDKYGVELLSNVLCLVDDLTLVTNLTQSSPSGFHRRRRLLTSESENSYRMEGDDHHLGDRYPVWLPKSDRRILKGNIGSIPVDTTVALDLSGNYRSIQAAVNKAPDNSTQRYVIHIKAGVYDEEVVVGKAKTNLMFLGDGVDVTVITGNKSVNTSDITTKFTATVTLLGAGFLARNLTIRNTAGPAGQQAVALRVASHKSAFTTLSLEGYQDTLYVHTFQQFYTYCTIYGTVDFIFGNAAAVFQHCTLLARVAESSTGQFQNITFTASGIRDSVTQKNAGLVFLSCTVDATPELVRANITLFPAFLGRPWHVYAKAVFINSSLGKLIDPKGWSLWNGLANSTRNVIFEEFNNTGPGAGNSTSRVTWSGQLTATEATEFTVDKFLLGSTWLPEMGIPYVTTI